MKRPIKVNIVLLVVLLFLPFGAGAQQPDRHSLELTWGVSIPTGSHFSDQSGFTALSLRGEYRIIPQLAIGVSAGFDRHSESGVTNDFFQGDFVTGHSERELLQIPLIAHVRYYLVGGRRSLLQPYLGVGGGVQWAQFNLTGDMINTSQADSWGFTVRPEIGTRIYPVRGGRLWLDAQLAFRSAWNRWDAAHIDVLGSFLPSIGVGVAF